MFEC